MPRFVQCLVMFAMLAATFTATGATTGRPNIVILLADDLGYGSVGAYGANPDLLRTPNIDRLAQQGMRFTDANTTSSVCTPSRYSILTGRYAWRTDLKYGVLGIKAPALIEPGRPTIASLLKNAGYNTAAIGKWHLGYGMVRPVDWTSELKPGPLEIGFDYHFGVPAVHGDATGIFIENHGVWGLRAKELKPFGQNYWGDPYLGIDAPQRDNKTVQTTITDHALEWLDKQTADKPFFLYYAPVPPHEPVTPDDAHAGKCKAGPYGDWIEQLDGDVGKMLAKLDEKGFAENTLVVFTSDNGGEYRQTIDGTQLIAIAAGLKINGDFRGGKHSIYEGGCRVPFVARWPGKVQPGSTSNQTVSILDLLATAAAVTGQALPAPDRGAEDSISFLPALFGQADNPAARKVLITHNVDGVFAIREGKWKYVEGVPAPPKKPHATEAMVDEQQLQLFNLAGDLAETTNVADKNPQVVMHLASLLDKARTENHTR